jgi:hypothetical protein
LCELLASFNELLTVKPDSAKLFAALSSCTVCSRPLPEQNAGCEQSLLESIPFFPVNQCNNELDRSDLDEIKLVTFA